MPTVLILLTSVIDEVVISFHANLSVIPFHVKQSSSPSAEFVAKISLKFSSSLRSHTFSC